MVVRPPGAATGILIARADGEGQERIVGNQFAGRVGFFLHVDDFSATYERMIAAGIVYRETAARRGLRPGRRFPRRRGQQWDLLDRPKAAVRVIWRQAPFVV